MPAALVRSALDGHSVLGLVFGALIYLVCLTGTVCVLVDEIKLLEQPTPAAGPLASGALDAAIASLLARNRGCSVVYAMGPTTPRQRLTLTASCADGEHAYIADTRGALVAQRTPFTDFVTSLHMTLTAPGPWGGLVVGLAGAALLALMISGVLAHPRIFRDAFRMKLDSSRRLREAELHNRLSVWGLPFHLAVTLSGALFGLSTLATFAVATLGFHGDTQRLLAPLTGPYVAANARPAPLPDLAAIVARAQAQVPGSHLGYLGIERPGTAGARIRVEVGVPGRLPRAEELDFDAQGRAIGRVPYLTGSGGLQLYSGAAQVHFGFFGGLPVRLVYVLLGAALTYVSASGIIIWLERQEQRGRVYPRMRRAWRAWVWGVPGALLIAALTAPMLPVSGTFWGVLLLAQGAVQLTRPRPLPQAA
jgi:uncharacterized iron-regulated membrane protein